LSSAPGSHHDEVLARVRTAATRLALAASFHVEALAAALDLRRTDIDCLLVLWLSGPSTPGQLGEATGLSSGGVSGVLDRLERAGFIRRGSDPGDRRRVVVSVAPGRAQHVEAALEPLAHALAAALDATIDRDLDTAVAFQEHHLEALTAATARLRAAQAGDGSVQPGGDGFYRVPAGAAAGALEFAGGIASLRLAADASMPELLRARIDGPIVVRERDGTVTFGGRHGAAAVEADGEITLNPSVPWRLRVRGGALRMTADLRPMALTEIAVSGGAADLEVALGNPGETVRIRVGGGDSRLAITRAAGVPVRIRASGGLADLELDGERRRGRPGLEWTTPGFDLDEPHLDIAIRGGMARITVNVG
jgi:DNA-binding MarR family transcriptional regulator